MRKDSKFMKKEAFRTKYANCIAILAVIVIHVIVMAGVFDFYYDLNDDTMMKDIMSGVYTGIPDGHNMQTLYPLGLFVSFLYRLCGDIPWYGLFLFLCQFGCLYLVGIRLCRTRKIIETGAILTLLIWGMLLLHLLQVQYTVTCAILCATAIFWFYTTPYSEMRGQFVKQNIPAVLLLLTAYLLRPEMMLLTLPFVGLAGFFRLTTEGKGLIREKLFRFGGIVGILAAGMLLFWGWDCLAYRSAQWSDFRAFFDARTTVYDFYPEIITEDGYDEMLEKIGISASQRELLRNYNFGLDEQINTEMLERIADCAREQIGGNRDWKTIFVQQFKEYLYRTFHSGDAPYNLMVLWMWAAALLQFFMVEPGQREKSLVRRLEMVWQLALLALARTSIWMFILMRGRSPERITHSLYIVEFAFLAGYLIWHASRCENVPERVSGTKRAMGVLFVMILLLNVSDNFSKERAEQQMRMQVEQEYLAIDVYAREHPDNFYFEDVYSTVSFSQHLLQKRDNTCANYDIMGGWMCKSPLYRQKLENFGISSAGEGLLKQENVFLILSDAEAKSGLTWIENYYDSSGTAVDVSMTDRIGEHYGVYEISRSVEDEGR